MPNVTGDFCCYSLRRGLQGHFTPGLSVRLFMLIAGPVINYLDCACYVMPPQIFKSPFGLRKS